MSVHFKQPTGRVPSINDPLQREETRKYFTPQKIEKVFNEKDPKMPTRVRKQDSARS